MGLMCENPVETYGMSKEGPSVLADTYGIAVQVVGFSHVANTVLMLALRLL